MKKTVLGVLMALMFMAVTSAYAMDATEEWVARYNGAGNGYDQACEMAVDNEGNVYVAGSSYGIDTNSDYAVVAYDSSGNQLWVARYDGPGSSYDLARFISVDNAGHVFVSGTTAYNSAMTTVAFDASTGTLLWAALAPFPYVGVTAMTVDNDGNVYVTGGVSFGNDEYDIVTIAYDSSGNELWTASYDNATREFSTAVAADNSGRIYLTGQIFENGDHDFITIAYNSASGEEIWSSRYNGPANSDDYGNAITIDKAGNVYVAGTSYNYYGGIDYAVVAYDPSGVELWVSRYNYGYYSRNFVYDMAVDNAGNIYVTGSGALSSYLTVAYNSSGTLLWTSHHNGGYYSTAIDLALDNAGHVFVTGGSGRDYGTVAYNSSTGTESWATRYNGPSNAYDSATAVAVDNTGNVYVTGYSYDYMTSYDFVTIKYSKPDLIAMINKYHAEGLIASQMVASLIDQATDEAYGAFINHVQAQAGKKIDAQAASALIKAAEYLKGN